jgi:hypothetical protein
VPACRFVEVLLRNAVLMVVLCLGAPGAATAQVVHGVVSDRATGEAVAAAVVVLLGADGVVAAAGLTDAHGRYEILAPGPGEYALRVEHMGYVTRSSTPFSLTAGERRERAMELDPEPIPLDTIRVRTGARERRDRTMGAV